MAHLDTSGYPGQFTQDKEHNIFDFGEGPPLPVAIINSEIVGLTAFIFYGINIEGIPDEHY